VGESNEYTELDIDDVLHNIDYEKEINRRNQEQMDAVSYSFLFFDCNIFILYTLLIISSQRV